METYLDRLEKFDVEWEVNNCVRLDRSCSQESDSRSESSSGPENRKRKLDITVSKPMDIDTSDLM